MTGQPTMDHPEPMMKVVSGRPTPEELAALVAVLAAVGGGEDEPEPARSAWSDPARRLCGPGPSRGGWRSSGLPR